MSGHGIHVHGAHDHAVEHEAHKGGLGQQVAIFSERDYTRKIVLKGRASETTRVEEVMTPKVITVTHRTNLRECMAIMSERNIRHLPVVDGDKVVGMVSIRDIVGDIIADQDFTIEQLEHYISGN